jgi:hypothetical protein
MASRSGGTPIRTRKVKPGPDQAFTLPKGTSAAPIMQVKVKPKPKTKKPKKSKNIEMEALKESILPSILLTAGVSPLVIHTIDKNLEKAEKKKQRTKSRKKQRGMSSGGSVNSRSIARKYFKGGLV